MSPEQTLTSAAFAQRAGNRQVQPLIHAFLVEQMATEKKGGARGGSQGAELSQFCYLDAWSRLLFWSFQEGRKDRHLRNQLLGSQEGEHQRFKFSFWYF